MRLNFILTGEESGGIRSFTLSTAKFAKDRGLYVRAIAYRSGQLTHDLHNLGIDVVILNIGRKSRKIIRGKFTMLWRIIRGLWPSKKYIKLFARIERHSDDVMIIPKVEMLIDCGAILRVLGLRGVWFMHNSLGHYPLNINRRIVQYFLTKNNIRPIGNSAYTAGTLGKKGQVPYVHLAVDTDLFCPSKESLLRQQLGISDGYPVFGLFATVNQDKGQIRCLEAFNSIWASGSEAYLLMAGGGESKDTQELKNRIKNSNRPECCQYLGTRDDLHKLYGVIDVGINARMAPEPFGLSVIECMSAGKPCLVVANGGPSETVTDGATGWHMKAGDTKSLEKGIKKAISDRDNWIRMGVEARQRVLRRYCLPVFYNDLIRAVEESL